MLELAAYIAFALHIIGWGFVGLVVLIGVVAVFFLADISEDE